jgi:phosphoribosylamine--glycine ligase
LTGGKGVKVQGDHFNTKREALEYCNEVLQTHPKVIAEEKLEGEEFSLQCLTDGKTVIAMPPVQDHKRAFVNDFGPNTGGMGSYSCEDHLLPFLSKDDVDGGLEITKKVVDVLYKETGEYYKGIMYAGLIKTKYGIKLLEYNARFGDPEAMNVLSLLESDFVEICSAMINQQLNKIKIKFYNKATVCKYIVPKGYPDNPVKDGKISIGKMPKDAKIYYASVDQKEDGLYLTSSRAIACLGISGNLEKAEKIAEKATKAVKGSVFHREDIGTRKLVEKRIRHMKEILS